MTKKSDTAGLWESFAQDYALTDLQVAQFKKYYDLLCRFNNFYNLTTITELKAVLQTHFMDSLALRDLKDLSKVSCIADVGSGAGFPGIPLKILYPHLQIILIEVIFKKVDFLKIVSKELKLEDIEVVQLDWRTFLRKTKYPVELFCARASLQIDELLRIFKPSSPYNQAELVYWASASWAPEAREVPFVKQDMSYKIGAKKRRLILFTRENS